MSLRRCKELAPGQAVVQVLVVVLLLLPQLVLLASQEALLQLQQALALALVLAPARPLALLVSIWTVMLTHQQLGPHPQQAARPVRAAAALSAALLQARRRWRWLAMPAQTTCAVH